MTIENSIRVFEDTPWKIGLRALVAFAFVAIGLAMTAGELSSSRYPEEFTRPAGAVVTAFFGWVFLTLLGRLLRPRELVLNANGFHLRGLFLDQFVSWRDVASFDVVERKLGMMAVTYTLKPHAAGAAILSGSQNADRPIDIAAEEGPVEIVRSLKAALDDYDGEHSSQ